jgi:hypothetical protein
MDGAFTLTTRVIDKVGRVGAALFHAEEILIPLHHQLALSPSSIGTPSICVLAAEHDDALPSIDPLDRNHVRAMDPGRCEMNLGADP